MSFFARLARALALLRLSWGLGDYDWSTIALLLQFQIARTARHIREHQTFVGWEKDVDTMERAVELIDRLLDEARDEDRAELGALLGAHLTEWWD